MGAHIKKGVVGAPIKGPWCSRGGAVVERWWSRGGVGAECAPLVPVECSRPCLQLLLPGVSIVLIAKCASHVGRASAPKTLPIPICSESFRISFCDGFDDWLQEHQFLRQLMSIATMIFTSVFEHFMKYEPNESCFRAKHTVFTMIS